MTTRQDVLREFGEPRQVTSIAGRTLLIYERDFPAGRGGGYGPSQPETIIQLSVLCDAHDVVIRKHHCSHSVDVVFGSGSISIGSDIHEKALAQIRINQTTLQEAKTLLGEPARESLTLNGNLEVQWLAQNANVAGGRNVRSYRLLFNEAGVAIASDNYQRSR